MRVEIRVLGEVVVRVDGAPVELGNTRQAVLLLALLADAGRPVPADLLVERVWGPDAPHNARSALATTLSRLRKTVPVRIDRTPEGYELGGDVDLIAFRRLVADADAGRDERLLRRALELWRGEPFAGVDLPWLAGTRAALHQEKLAAQREHDERTVRPRQLPASPAVFSGRTRELAEISRSNHVVICGQGGIGKTALALHWAHRNADRFPDGQLYADLRGFAPAGAPMPPTKALRVFLRALGVQDVPVNLPEQVALYRELIGGRRMLVLLDNARDESQVEPLLPRGDTCTVLITSRNRMGTNPLSLNAFGPAESADLIARQLGADRIDAEPDAVGELVERCAGLPLALGIVTARALTHPSFPLASLAEELERTADRLDALDAGDLRSDLRTTLSWSLDGLDEDAAEVFGLLGLAPGPDTGPRAAAALVGRAEDETRRLLRKLEAAHLVSREGDRYRMHDLVRLYAAEQVAPMYRKEAVRRVVDFYLHTARLGDRRLTPSRPPVELAPPAPGVTVLELPDLVAATTWFDVEIACIVDAQKLAEAEGLDDQVWQIAWALGGYHWRRGHVQDNVATLESALAATVRLGQPGPEIIARRLLATAYSRAGRDEEGRAELVEALALAERFGDANSEAHVLVALAWNAESRNGDYAEALGYGTRALRLFERLGDHMWQGELLNSTGWYLAHLGRYDEARESCERALTLHRQPRPAKHAGLDEGEASALDSLGYIATRTGRHAEAVDHYEQAVRLFRDMRNSREEAVTLENLADALSGAGRVDEARAAWRQALDLYREQRLTANAQRVEDRLAARERR